MYTSIERYAETKFTKRNRSIGKVRIEYLNIGFREETDLVIQTSDTRIVATYKNTVLFSSNISVDFVNIISGISPRSR